VYSNLPSDITNTFDLSFLYPTNPILTKYFNNSSNSNSVINLIFFRSNFLELDNHLIFLKLQHPSNYTFFIVDIYILGELVPDIRYTIIKNSKEEMRFTLNLISKKLLEIC